MSALRTAAQQALEALQLPCSRWNGTQSKIVDDAITALRAALVEDALQRFTNVSQEIEAALAEPAQEPQCNPHPKAPHSFMRNASHNEDRYVCECEGWEPYEAGYQAGMEAALAEPPTDWEAVAADQAMTIALMKAEQVEPVAWMVYTLDGKSVCVTDNPADFTDEHRVLPLYTSPPQRKPEPVALDWLHKWANQDDGEPETQWHEGYEAARRVVKIHLTAPPQRKPLTEE